MIRAMQVNKEKTVEKKQTFFKRLAKNKVAFAALWFIVIVHVVVFLGPFIYTVSPDEIGSTTTPLSGWSLKNPLGTDELGRDVLSRLLHGGRITLSVGFAAMIFSVFLGTVIGAIAGFFGRVVESILMRFTEAMMSIPNFFFVIVAVTVLGSDPMIIILVIALSSWMEIARVVYGETLKWKEYEFVEAAVASGASKSRILLRYIIPQVYPSIIVSATLGIAWAILTESAISYLGFGIQPPMPTWGTMLQNAQQYVWSAPLLGVLPGLAITLIVLAYNFLGDGLRDIMDPRNVNN